MADIVLVHGTTQTSAGFARLRDALRRRGHRPLTVDVPSGTGAGSVEHADLLAAQLPADLDRPVVAAHSAGGLLLPALAARLDSDHQVWMAAVVPDFAGGRGFRAELRADPAAVVDPEWIGVDPAADHAAAARFLFHDADPATLREALATVAVCDLATVYAEDPPLDPAARPSTYLLPTGDRTLRPSWMAAAARERLGVEPVELPGGHNNHVAHAEEVAAAISSAIAGAAAERS